MIKSISVAVPEHRAVPCKSKVRWSSPFHSRVKYEEYLKRYDYVVGANGVAFITRTLKHNGLVMIATVKVYFENAPVVEFSYAPSHALLESLA